MITKYDYEKLLIIRLTIEKGRGIIILSCHTKAHNVSVNIQVMEKMVKIVERYIYNTIE